MLDYQEFTDREMLSDVSPIERLIGAMSLIIHLDRAQKHSAVGDPTLEYLRQEMIGVLKAQEIMCTTIRAQQEALSARNGALNKISHGMNDDLSK